jgi:4-amino-4-deoxy-L-arabinose transferase-like glycosyltransferase
MPPPIASAGHRLRTWLLLVVSAIVLVAWQCLDLGWAPLQAWDESRLAVNAIEMLDTGARLATTYGFTPDLWNTKPPLAINLMAWSMAAFGPTEFALRLPAALAACATVAMVVWFVRRVTASTACAIGAGVLLATAPLFYGYHAGGTGDYDAVLTMFTTGYAIVLFDLIERDGPARRHAAGAGVLLGLAILTKGIAGVIPGVGIAAYTLVFAFGTLPRRWVDYAVVVAIGATIGAVFYLLRGAAGDGYVAAVSANELGGRFGRTLDHHSGNRWFYLRELTDHAPGRAWPVLVSLLALERGQPRRLAIFCLCQIIALVLVYSSAATKFSWYILPAEPFVAIALALGGFGVVRLAERKAPRTLAIAVQVVLLAVVVAFAAQAARNRYLQTYAPFTRPRAFGTLIDAAAQRHMLPLVVVDGGFDNATGFVHYSPTLRFYRLAAQRRGQPVTEATTIAGAGASRFIGSCDAAVPVARLGAVAWQGAGCVLVAR